MIDVKKLLTKILQSLIPSEASGTLGTTTVVTSSDNHRCYLVKTGKTVRAYIGIGYHNGTTQLGSGTTFFTIPEGYRPSSQKIFPAIAYRATGVTICANVVINTNGVVTQSTAANITAIYAVAEWTV